MLKMRFIDWQHDQLHQSFAMSFKQVAIELWPLDYKSDIPSIMLLHRNKFGLLMCRMLLALMV